jgi:hypothetical protein
MQQPLQKADLVLTNLVLPNHRELPVCRGFGFDPPIRGYGTVSQAAQAFNTAPYHNSGIDMETGGGGNRLILLLLDFH